MATQLQELTIDTQLTSSAATIVSSTEYSAAFIGSAIFTNTNTTVETVTVWRLGETTPASSSNYLAKKDILPGKTWHCSQLIGQVVSNLSRIQASATTPAFVNANLSGTVSN